MKYSSHCIVAIAALSIGLLLGVASVPNQPSVVSTVAPVGPPIDPTVVTDGKAAEVVNQIRSASSPRAVLLDRFNNIADDRGVTSMTEEAEAVVKQLHDYEIELQFYTRWAQCSVAQTRKDFSSKLVAYWNEAESLMRELRARRLWNEIAFLVERANAYPVVDGEDKTSRIQFEAFVDAMQSHREYYDTRRIGATIDYPNREYLQRLYSEAAASTVALAADDDLELLTFNVSAVASIANARPARFSSVRFVNTTSDELCWNSIRLCELILNDKTRRFAEINSDTESQKAVSQFAELLRNHLHRRMAL